jgi:ABC-type ATPase involved in cell division
MIQIQNIKKTFAKREQLFNGLNLQVFPSTLSVVTGLTGSGKSTLLKMVRGDIKPDSGRIMVNGKDVNKLNNRSKMVLKRTIAMICQESNLLDNRTVIENIALPMRIQGIHGAPLKNRVEKLIEIFGLEKLAYLSAGILSGGEKRKVTMARSLVGNPTILLADEPASGLDPESTREIISILYKLPYEDGTTVLIATHSPALLEGLGVHGTFTIKNGKIDSGKKKSIDKIVAQL